MNEPAGLATRFAAVRPPCLRFRRVEIPVGDDVFFDAFPLEVLTLVRLDLELTVAIDVAKVGDGTRCARRAFRDLDDNLAPTGNSARDLFDLGG
ncbi:MAG TPA: hypothetical protein VJ738_03300 [Steroidobacteraceae bacterium]|nr:hypothetical protein [Steroidobacteraceae bacterium]